MMQVFVKVGLFVCFSRELSDFSIVVNSFTFISILTLFGGFLSCKGTSVLISKCNGSFWKAIFQHEQVLVGQLIYKIDSKLLLCLTGSSKGTVSHQPPKPAASASVALHTAAHWLRGVTMIQGSNKFTVLQPASGNSSLQLCLRCIAHWQKGL